MRGVTKLVPSLSRQTANDGFFRPIYASFRTSQSFWIASHCFSSDNFRQSVVFPSTNFCLSFLLQVRWLGLFIKTLLCDHWFGLGEFFLTFLFWESASTASLDNLSITKKSISQLFISQPLLLFIPQVSAEFNYIFVTLLAENSNNYSSPNYRLKILSTSSNWII